MKAKELQTELEKLNLADRLRDKYFRAWLATTDDDMWPHIRAKLNVIDDVMGELRKAVNREGVDNGKRGT